MARLDLELLDPGPSFSHDVTSKESFPRHLIAGVCNVHPEVGITK